MNESTTWTSSKNCLAVYAPILPYEENPIPNLHLRAEPSQQSQEYDCNTSSCVMYVSPAAVENQDQVYGTSLHPGKHFPKMIFLGFFIIGVLRF